MTFTPQRGPRRNRVRPYILRGRWPGPNVRFGSKADIPRCKSYVRFTPKSGHSTTHQSLGIFLAYDKSIPQAAICFQWRGSMIDAVLNVAIFAALVLCIVGFGAWARKRVP